MGYIFSLAVFILYAIALTLLKTDQLMFGFKYMIEFVFIVLQFALDKPISIPYYEYTLSEVNNLKTGYIFHFTFFVLFFLVALYFRVYNPENVEKEVKMKKLLGIIVFIVSATSLFAGANNHSEYQRQLKLMSAFSEMSVEEDAEALIINNKITLSNIHSNGATFDPENRRVVLSTDKYNIDIIKLSNDVDYPKLIKKRYSYNLRDLLVKETKFKNTPTHVVEYFTNTDYNRDYVLRIDKDFFVIRFKSFNSKNIDAIESYKNILIYSVHLKEEEK